MKLSPTAIPAVQLLEPRVFDDARGFFMETYQAKKLAAAGIEDRFVQDSHAGSSGGVLRGLHYQLERPQGKLVRVVVGSVFDVAVDLRRSSPTFKRWVGCTLSADNRLQLWVPPGFAHGFYVTSAWAEVLYKATDFYAPEHERCVRYDDPEIAVAWPLQDGAPPVLSAKDHAGRWLSEVDLYD